ncbi:MAG: L-threonylcarbamoyladenylate synthase [Candidatus Bathyarchaeia archaeon]
MSEVDVLEDLFLIYSTRIFKASEESILKASSIVKDGGLIVYPTDTVYGLGCDPKNPVALRRLIGVKGERQKPLPILASDLEVVYGVSELPKEVRRVAECFWPGPLTLVLKRRIDLPNELTCGSDSVGLRIPNHQATIKLIRLCGGLLVGTSANRTGSKPPRDVQEAFRELGDEVDIYIDGGLTPLGVSSTVLDFTSTKPRVLREGPIKFEEVIKVLSR